jgi:hypothetical protein
VTDDGILMRLALDEASAAADRGDPGGSAPSWLGPDSGPSEQYGGHPSQSARPRRPRRSPRGVPSAGQQRPQRLHVLWHRRTVSNVQRSTAAYQDQPDRARC